jgi:hypothetical protein
MRFLVETYHIHQIRKDYIHWHSIEIKECGHLHAQLLDFGCIFYSSIVLMIFANTIETYLNLVKVDGTTFDE